MLGFEFEHINILAFLCAVLLFLIVLIIAILAQERNCDISKVISRLFQQFIMNKSKSIKSKEPSKFSFRKKQPVEVVDVDSDSDFADFDVVTSDNTDSNTTDTDAGDFKDLQTRKGQKKNDKEEWNDILGKMRKGLYTAEKHQEAKQSWKGLLGIMQKNQNATTAKSKGNSSSKRQLKQSQLNQNIKRAKSVSLRNELPTKSEAVKNVDAEEVVLSDDDMSHNNNNYSGKDINIENTVPPPVPVGPLCPIFLRPSASTKDSPSLKCEDMDKNATKPWDLVHSGNPWICNTTVNLVPEGVQISVSSYEDTKVEMGGKPPKHKPKTCPFYKKLPGTNFSVDAFDCGVIPGIDVYLLSHFHSDHYQGLTSKFKKKLICSGPTANLVKMKLGVSDQYIIRLELNKPYMVQGTEIVLVDANHCPGSVMFILKIPNGNVYLHTGDFRYTPEMLANLFLQKLRVDCLYLDTTYCDSQYNFPTQSDAIIQAITTIKKHLTYRPKTLIVCGTYCIGKERVFCAIADALNTKVFCLYDKKRIINALENPYFKQLLGDKEENCQVHVMPMFKLNAKVLSEYLSSKLGTYSNIFAIKPTGWEFSKGPGKSSVGSNVRSHCNDTVTVMGVPYSEHSSFSELRDFVTTIKPTRVQPTVNVGNAEKRTAMMAHIDKWLSGC